MKVIFHTDGMCNVNSVWTKYIKVLCYIMKGKKSLNRSKLTFVWFEKLNKQTMMGSFRRVEAINVMINLPVFEVISGDHDWLIAIEG